MATQIDAEGDVIRIEQSFVSGKHKIKVNGEVAWEGKIFDREPLEFTFGPRAYRIKSKTVGAMNSAVTYRLEIRENSELIHSGLYDQAGKPARSEAAAKANSGAQMFGVIGGICGFVGMMVANAATGAVPGGAIGGAIGGGGGYAIGYGIGVLMFGTGK